MEMEAEVDWRRPKDLVLPEGLLEQAPAKGEASQERALQEQRERQQVSAVYFSKDHIPDSPAESFITTSESNKGPTIDIPLTRSGLQAQVINVTEGQRKAAVPSPVDLSNLLQGIKSSTTTAPIVPPPFPPMPMVPGMPLASQIPGIFPPPPPHHLAIPSMLQPGSTNNMSAPVFPPFLPGVTPPQMMQAMRPPFPFPPPPPNMMRPPPLAPAGPPPFQFPPVPGTNQRPPLNPLLNPRLHTKPCKFYKAGQPGSCRFGASCAFLHQD